MRADALVGAAARTSWGVFLWGKAIKDGLILSGGLSVMPALTGRVWHGVVVRHMDKVLPLLVKYMIRETSSLRVQPSCDGTVTVVDTSGVRKRNSGWNDRVLNGLYKMLARTVAQTFSINTNELGHTENNLRTMLLMRFAAPRWSLADEPADNLLACVTALVVGRPMTLLERRSWTRTPRIGGKRTTPPTFATSRDTFSWSTTPRVPNSAKNSKPKRV